jgi:hypothetical protein
MPWRGAQYVCPSFYDPAKFWAGPSQRSDLASSEARFLHSLSRVMNLYADPQVFIPISRGAGGTAYTPNTVQSL